MAKWLFLVAPSTTSYPDSIGILSRFKKINSSFLIMESHKCSNLAVIRPTPREEQETFGQEEQGGERALCISLLLATEAGP